MCGLFILMTYWNDSQTVARWEQPWYETVRKIYHSHLAGSHLAAPPGHLLWHHILVPGSQCPSQGCKRGFICPMGPLWTWNTSPLLTVPFLTTKISSLCFAVLIAFSVLLNFILVCFSKSIFMSYFVNVPLIHNKRLCSPRGSITTAITLSLLNHKLSNLPGRALQCSPRREMSKAKSSPQQYDHGCLGGFPIINM